jgi:hypothetical protein
MASFNAGETSIKGLQEACGKIGLECLPVRTDSRELGRLLGTAPAMRALVLLTSRHFCYVSSCRDGKFHISRWPFEPEWVTPEQLDRAWAGEALLVSREPIPPSVLSTGMKGRGLMFTVAGASMLFVGSIWALCAWRKPRRGRHGSPPA